MARKLKLTVKKNQRVKPAVVKKRRRRACPICVDRNRVIDYKDTNRLQRYLTDRGKIAPSRNTCICAKHQRVIASAIKRARTIGLLPFCID